MAVERDEQSLRFTFGDAWRVLSFDDHPDTRKHVGKLSGRKAVDFVGLHREQLYLIEVKDFRGARVQNRNRLTTGGLAEEVSLKAFDTLAGLVLAHRHDGADPLWADAIANLSRGRRRPVVALWLEDEAAWSAKPGDRAGFSVLKMRLEQRCGPLDARAALVHAANPVLPDVTASNLPGAGRV